MTIPFNDPIVESLASQINAKLAERQWVEEPISIKKCGVENCTSLTRGLQIYSTVRPDICTEHIGFEQTLLSLVKLIL